MPCNIENGRLCTNWYTLRRVPTGLHVLRIGELHSHLVVRAFTTRYAHLLGLQERDGSAHMEKSPPKWLRTASWLFVFTAECTTLATRTRLRPRQIGAPKTKGCAKGKSELCSVVWCVIAWKERATPDGATLT